MPTLEELGERQNKLEYKQDKTEEMLQSFILMFEKYITKQDITNSYIKESIEQNRDFMHKFDEKLELHKKEVDNKIEAIKKEQDNRYIEMLKVNYQQDLSSEKKSKSDSFKEFLFDWSKEIFKWAITGGLLYYILTKK